ncbi:MAG: hypothetical protein IJC89_01910 [Clostridia bacterium]|nr:hypothetical protein [Clostridia bacterium]
MSRKNKDYNMFSLFMPFVGMAFLLTIIGFFAVGLVYIFVPFSVWMLKIISLVISIISLVIVTCVAGRRTASVFTGGIIALIYSVIRWIIAVATGSLYILSFRSPFVIISGFLIGIIGGIIGTGTATRRKRRYR